MEDQVFEAEVSAEIAPEVKSRIISMYKEEGRNTGDVTLYLTQQGMEESKAMMLSQSILVEVNDELLKSRANKDILFGSLWCVGGTILTLADVGFIFWGAIVFGGIQLFRGLLKMY